MNALYKKRPGATAYVHLEEIQLKLISIIHSDTEKQFQGIKISKSYNPFTKVHSLFIN